VAYQKLLIDNSSCSRRFHLYFDDEAAPVSEARVECPFCGVDIFSQKNHAPLRLARQENLVNTAHLSDQVVSECRFEDVLSKKTNGKSE
jgi:hypothetical protein